MLGAFRRFVIFVIFLIVACLVCCCCCCCVSSQSVIVNVGFVVVAVVRLCDAVDVMRQSNENAPTAHPNLVHFALSVDWFCSFFYHCGSDILPARSIMSGGK